MTAKTRIAAIRLSDKVERNPEYAEKLGISVNIGKVEVGKKNTKNDGLGYCNYKER